MYIKRRNKEENLYNRLQKQSLEMIQELSGNRWTDFNEHDPGVTLLDVLNYALLELQYQLEFPFEEYLSNPVTKELCFEKVGLLPAREIFHPVVVSLHDYEQLFLHEISDITDCRMKREPNSLYSLQVEGVSKENQTHIRNKVMKVYHQHRNLCENLITITFNQITDKVSGNRKQLNDLHYESIPESVQFSPIEHAPYRSVQLDLPDCYGINERGLPAGASSERKMEALQLKAYLLIFDYLISGVRQQAGGISTLLGLSNEIPSDFCPDVQINDLHRLLDANKQRQTTVLNPDEKHKQKSLFFDRLDMLYGEDTRSYENRPELIRRFPEFNTLRFRSFNVLDETAKGIAGIEHLVDSFPYYLVEHILLWDDEAGQWGTPETWNKLTIVIPRWVDRITSREKYLHPFEERLPAHLHIQCLWLELEDIREFEKYYFKWRRAWAMSDMEQVMKYSIKIGEILN